jgi:Chaperone of endosialidase
MAALDFPNSPTVGATYTAPNGAVYTWDGAAWTVSGVLSTGSAAGGDLQGTYPNPSIKPAALPWTPSGAALTPTDATKTVGVPGGAAGAGYAIVTLGSNLTKARVYSNNTQAIANAALSANMQPSGTQDDATKPSWLFQVNANSDSANVYRTPAGGALALLLALDNTGALTLGNPPAGADGFVLASSGSTGGGKTHLGMLAATGGWALRANASLSNVMDDTSRPAWSLQVTESVDQFNIYRAPAGATPAWQAYLILANNGDFQIAGANATKASGTTWANPSDPRLKQDIAPYDKGLAEVCQLEPITYHLKADPDGSTCYGFDAEKVRPIFPECVTETTMKLAPDDAEATPGVLAFDMHPIVVALVNVVKELTARVAALEAAAHA